MATMQLGWALSVLQDCDKRLFVLVADKKDASCDDPKTKETQQAFGALEAHLAACATRGYHDVILPIIETVEVARRAGRRRGLWHL